MNPPESTVRVPRFTRTERIAHWVNAALFTVAMSTGAMFRFGIGQSLISDRALVRGVHVYTGLGIVVAFLIAVIPRWGRALRRDASRINRWSPDEIRWLKSLGRARGARLGKFNPGQKLNAAFVPAAALVLAASGAIMFWNRPFSTELRNGADFVHQSFAWLIWITVAGHILLALQDRESLRGMTGGTVSTEWARDHRPAWYAEVTSVTPEAAEPVDA
ncbi:MAG: cytochrome b/b6 domain-containing protein [Acidimicrobiia bacterium]|nr:cytochrome b/b6 domain-containing protein [Acidimicrobiia bacterium]